ncbi:hypothetical protein HYU20_04215 [Candidatus Woesearchaeota archaeon]|nr:hypothetical protein [Candidatus Woesearchaeota archaeon]
MGFSVLVQNGGGEDLEDVEVELVIEGLNIEETESIGTLGEREDDEATFDEEVPDDAEDGTYAGHIIIAGTDSFGQVHRARRNFRIEVDREQHDLRITEANVQADCNGFASIGFTIANYGRSSEKEVRVNISGANSSGMVFQLDTDSERSGTIALLAGQGTQQVLLSVHDSKLKLNDEKSLPLQLPACVKDTSQLKKQQKEEITVVTFPKVEQEKTAKPEDGRASKLSRDGRLMLARLLAAYAAVMLLAVGAVLVLKKRDKKG